MEMVLKLIDTKSKTRLLLKMLERPNSVFSVSELGRLSDLPKASVSGIITQWEQTGLVLAKQQGRNKLISLNPKFYLLPELKKIFKKTRDFQKPLTDQLMSFHSLKKKQVKAIVLYGSRNRNDFSHTSDLDVMIGMENKNTPFTETIVEEFVKATTKTGIRFSPTLLSKKEIQTRLKEKDLFIQNIMTQGKILKGGKWLEHLQTTS
ncbi:MAG: nucleotidyltransferase domain-containing protein [archaeon]|nr:nucleotidyltransferase domain-containing protein [archaeon]